MEIVQKLWDSANAVAEKIIFDARFKKLLNISVYIVLPVVLAVLSFGGFADQRMFTSFGSLAQALILALLFMKPFGVVFKIQILKRVLIYRRHMGVAMFYLALFHMIGLVDPAQLTDATNYTFANYMVYGFAAMFGTALLALTSNDVSMRLLKRNWKRLHYLAYPVLLLVLVHAGMSKSFGGELVQMLLVFGLFVVMKVLELKRITFTLPIISK